jgi:predicted CopG family antitoxin
MATVSVPRQVTSEVIERLYQNRLELKNDMQRVLGCFSNDEKRQLVNEWKQKYSESKVEELIRFAKNKKACYTIAHWDIDNFRSTRK